MSKLLRKVTKEETHWDQGKEVANRFNQDCVGRNLNVAYAAVVMNLELLIRHTPLTMEDVVEAVRVLGNIYEERNDKGYIQVDKVVAKA